MKISVANDHRGVDLKIRLVSLLEQLGHEVHNFGTDDSSAVDYPDFAAKVCQEVVKGEGDRGILICGSGIGMNIAANKHAGIRAARAQDEYDAEWCRRHNDVNVLCLSADRIGKGAIDRIVEIWLNTEFEAGRHARRVSKLGQIEQRNDC